MQSIREWSEISKLLRRKEKQKQKHQSRILHPEKLPFKNKGEIHFIRQTKIEESF